MKNKITLTDEECIRKNQPQKPEVQNQQNLGGWL
jgi:hypothetical protein